MKAIPTAMTAAVLAGCATQVSTRHYVAVYDPQEQTTQELYRIDIKGYAPYYSNVDFGSGWVSARAAALLDGRIELPPRNTELDPPGRQPAERGENGGKPPAPAAVAVDGDPIGGSARKFFEAGPLGVTTRPHAYRFVVVMGADPDLFFQKMGALTRFGSDPDLNREREERARQVLLQKLGEQQLLVERSLAELEEGR